MGRCAVAHPPRHVLGFGLGCGGWAVGWVSVGPMTEQLGEPALAEHEGAALAAGKLQDLISGQMVPATPEEVDAVQPFLKQLVEDYGYPPTHIRSRPQWRVKARPSDRRKEYPVDIAVFNGSNHVDDNIEIIVECKQKNRKDGRGQLEDYLRLSRASLGVWFNGDQRLFLRKLERGGKVLFEELPNIPRYGERVQDVGLYTRETLIATRNLRPVFRSIRNYLAANAVGMTRDEALAQQLINLIFCKIYDERFTRPDRMMTLRAGFEEPAKEVAQRAHDLFNKVKTAYDDVFEKSDRLRLDNESIRYIVGELQPYSLMESDRDAVADAFETFIGPSLKGAQGQFFTPRNVVSLVMTLVDPKYSEIVFDPACGSGGFLVEALRHMWAGVDQDGETFSWPASEVEAEKQKAAIRGLRGIDKDEFLSKVAKSYMAILGDGRGGIYCENSLVNPTRWSAKARQEVVAGKFDVIVTNPPFGQKLKISDAETLQQYALGHKWKVDRTSGHAEETDKLQQSQTPQILFVERCLDLLTDGGRLGIVLPESMVCNPSHRYILQYILSRARIVAVVSLPEEVFQPYTHAKTCVVVIEKTLPSEKHHIFMAAARWCGHDSRGLSIPHDDLPEIQKRFAAYREGALGDFNHLGFTISSADIQDYIYLPKYYNPELSDRLEDLRPTHDLVRLGELADRGVLSVSTGDEVGKLAYGTGPVPFIRTSDIVNWELKHDAKHGLSATIYDDLKKKQDVRTTDILMVRDGTYLVGTVGMVTELDEKIVYQSHILKFRSESTSELDPFLLMALLSAPIVKEQVWAKRFTQDIIDTLGARWRELMLPIPRDQGIRESISAKVKQAIEARTSARLLARSAVIGVAPHDDFSDDAGYEFAIIGR